MANVVLFNKPYGVLSQFTDADGHPGLAHHLSLPGFRAAGRLDRDSEGLLVLTDSGPLQARITEPRFRTLKTYWVQVEGSPDLALWHKTLRLKDGPAKFVTVSPLTDPPVWPRTPPIRVRKAIPDSWVAVSIDEGRNRQVRRMTAALGHPTLRLIRIQSGAFELNDLQPGEHRAVELPASYQQLAAPSKTTSMPRPRPKRGDTRRGRS